MAVGLKKFAIPLGLLYILDGLESRVGEDGKKSRVGDFDRELDGDETILRAFDDVFKRLFLLVPSSFSVSSPLFPESSICCAAIFALYLAIIAGQFKCFSGSQVDSSTEYPFHLIKYKVFCKSQ